MSSPRPAPDRTRLLAIILAVLVVAVGGMLVKAGLETRDGVALKEQVAEARRAVADGLGQRVAQARQQFDTRRRDEGLIEVLRSEQVDDARALLAGDWARAEAVEFFNPDVTDAWNDVDAFGYGKLGLLLQALRADDVRVAVIGTGSQRDMGFAAAIRHEGQVLALAYVAQPLAGWQQAVTAPAGGYVAVRQGRVSVIEQGDAGLAGSAETGAVELAGSPLRVVAAAPPVPVGMLGLSGTPALAVGALIILLGVGIAVAPQAVMAMARRGAALASKKGGDAAGDDVGPTLAELKAEGKVQAPPAPAVAPKPAAPPPVAPSVAVERTIFRAYDIRGVVGKSLDAQVARLIGRAVGATMKERGLRQIVIGGDGRTHTPEMRGALADGLTLAGIDVTDIGLAPTPLVYFAAEHWGVRSGIAVTGSHNPPEYNGFKIVIDGETLSGDAIMALYERIAENRLPMADTKGMLDTREAQADYVQRISDDIQAERRLKVVVDAGSGVAGAVAPDLLRAIGVDVEELYCEVDGSFPYHHPDPSDPENLGDLVRAVQRVGADVGLAFDGDGDRLGVVTPSGKMIFPDRLLMLFAADILERNPGACVIFDVKCTGALTPFVLRHGGSPLMWKTGHSLIKAKMKETEAELAGEMSGHFFFRERWYGFDDGIYAACRLVEILATRMESADEVFAEIPDAISTPELKVEMAEGEPHAFIEEFTAKAKFEGARLSTIDGVRADWADGWGLVRASNTTPVLVLRFEANDTEAMQRIQNEFRSVMLALRPGLTLPF